MNIKKKVLQANKGNILIIIILIVGVAIMLYPTISNMWNNYLAKSVIEQYEKNINSSSLDFKKEMDRAIKYNKNLSPKSVPDAFSSKQGKRDKEYEKCLDIGKGGVMAYIEIAVIDVKLPIYHYTDKDNLKKGVGHLAGSSLPIGGKGFHSVLSAHRGLPSAKLFTDLNLLKDGDVFVIHVLDKKLMYEVDSVRIVKPEQTESLKTQKGKDYITLVTCTPYGVNSHRILVRGHRIPYREDIKDVGSRVDKTRITMILISILIGLLLAGISVALMNEKIRYKIINKIKKK